MEVRVPQECPTIFLGQPFGLQIIISNVSAPFDQIVGQVVGTVRAIRSHAFKYVQSLLPPKQPPPESSLYFDHIKTDFCVFSSAGTFLLTITATDIPPSYEGIAIEVSYLLLIRCRTGTALSVPIAFPLRVVGNANSSFNFGTTQQNGRISLELLPTETVPARLLQHSPFPWTRPEKPNSYFVSGDGREIALVQMYATATAGDAFMGIIRVTNQEVGLESAEVKFVRREVYDHGQVVEISEVVNRKVDLKGFAARKFWLQLPFVTVASFTTEFLTVSYGVDLTFSSASDQWNWTEPITVIPPLVSLTKPRVPKTE
jgi:hypothetical protein